MDEDDTATPPDGSSGGGRQVVNQTSARRAELERRMEEINNEIERLEANYQGEVGDNPQLDAQIRNLYDQHRIITLEQDYGSGYDAYDEDAIQNPDDALPPQPPHPPPPPPPPNNPNPNFAE